MSALVTAEHGMAQSRQSQPTTASVWCFDRALGTVSRRPSWLCKGEVIGDEQAARIKSARVDRVRRAVSERPTLVVPGKRVRGTGTGFFVTSRGLLLTNHHVVRGCAGISVVPSGRDERRAHLRAHDAARDLALLDAGLSSPRPARLRTGNGPGDGESTTVVGYPQHGLVTIRTRMVTGKVDASIPLSNRQVFAMRIDVRRGNSGGPVLDDAGDVTGVVFAKVDTPTVYAKTGKLVRNVGVGMRPKLVRNFLKRHNVKYQSSPRAAALASDQRLKRAQDFVAQVRCWK